MTRCSCCGKSGHNKRSCPSKKRKKAPTGGGAGAAATKRSKRGGGTCGVQQPMTRAALARAIAEADEPGDLPCFPAAVRNGRRFPWSIALQFAAARDLATLASTHTAARDVCRHEKTAKRIVKARHGRGCKRAKDTKCKCPGCARVALLLHAADELTEEVDAADTDNGSAQEQEEGEADTPKAASGGSGGEEGELAEEGEEGEAMDVDK